MTTTLYLLIGVAAGLVLLGALAWRLRRRAAFRRLPPLPAAGGDGMVRLLDVSYVEGSGAHPVRHRLDIYAPVGAGKKLPVLLFLHGGGWAFGHKSSATLGIYNRTGETFARLGMIVVMANYRLSPWVRHPEHVRDVAQAFAWTRKHIAHYGGDPSRLFVGGHSAGGHLAALLATDPRYLAEHGLRPEHIRGCVVISGVYRIGDFVTSLARVPVARFFGAMGPVFGSEPAGRIEASPITHVSARMPPTLVLYGDAEWYGLGRQADEFLIAGKAVNAHVEGQRIDGRNHVTIMSKATQLTDPVVVAVGDFINRWR